MAWCFSSSHTADYWKLVPDIIFNSDTRSEERPSGPTKKCPSCEQCRILLSQTHSNKSPWHSHQDQDVHLRSSFRWKIHEVTSLCLRVVVSTAVASTTTDDWRSFTWISEIPTVHRSSRKRVTCGVRHPVSGAARLQLKNLRQSGIIIICSIFPDFSKCAKKFSYQNILLEHKPTNSITATANDIFIVIDICNRNPLNAGIHCHWWTLWKH